MTVTSDQVARWTGRVLALLVIVALLVGAAIVTVWLVSGHWPGEYTEIDRWGFFALLLFGLPNVRFRAE